jgi:hypothetical protein
MFRCLMLSHLRRFRLVAVEHTMRAYGPKMPPVDVLACKLMLSPSEVQTLIQASGYSCTLNDRGIAVKHRDPNWRESFVKWNCFVHFDINRSKLMHHGLN